MRNSRLRRRDPEFVRLHHLQRQFRRVSRRAGLDQVPRWYVMLVLGTFAVAVVLSIITVASPWPVGLTLRHIAAAPNCSWARLVGLAPAYVGEPGYYRHHDADHDGIACEPWPH